MEVSGFMTYVREEGEGSDAVSTALAKSVEYRDQAGLNV